VKGEEMSMREKDWNSLKTALSVMLLAILAAGTLSSCTSTADNQSTASHNEAQANRPTTSSPMGEVKLGVPGSIAAEHRELHEELEAAIKSGRKTGDAAKIVEERLSAHFEKEERYALPQLGLLGALAEGRVSEEMRPAIELSDKLKADMPKMLEEHKGIVVALDALKEAAAAENRPQAVSFAEKLSAHAQNEEQVMYPAAILVGEYLKLKLKP
jgi:hypothetical protein